jgi:ABC-2 type transport system ATP-binding protein
MSDLVIETHSLHKQYGHTKAVDGLEMHVPRGSVYGFLGRNGAGKTTTIRLLAGLIQPKAGRARVLDLDPQADRIAILERTSFVIDKVLLPSMTGNDLVRFNRGFFPRWSDALARKYTDALEIPMKQKFRKLSTGNQTKLCLLLALSQGAELLVLDEPTAGLDPIVTDQLLRIIIDDFAGEGRTLLLSSHHLSEVERVADWIGIIDRARCCSKRSSTICGRISAAFALWEKICVYRRATRSSGHVPARGQPNMSYAPTQRVSPRTCEARGLRCSTSHP